MSSPLAQEIQSAIDTPISPLAVHPLPVGPPLPVDNTVTIMSGHHYFDMRYSSLIKASAYCKQILENFDVVPGYLDPLIIRTQLDAFTLTVFKKFLEEDNVDIMECREEWNNRFLEDRIPEHTLIFVGNKESIAGKNLSTNFLFLMKAWILGDFLEAREFQNKVMCALMDALAVIHEDNNEAIPLFQLDVICNTLPEDSPLVLLAQKCVKDCLSRDTVACASIYDLISYQLSDAWFSDLDPSYYAVSPLAQVQEEEDLPWNPSHPYFFYRMRNNPGDEQEIRTWGNLPVNERRRNAMDWGI